MKRILVTGSNGQLGKTIQDLGPEYRGLDFNFTDKATLDITQSEEVSRIFQEFKPNYCINCAAFTQV
ncbi:MAG: sugar nucleotide-binding protein, partial [Eudoraea sp.]|nr:sugar nucleotide-binding protein [Eudoraea sp.]NNJ41357.1 sugar nucleotide-binding protein [Eudoraea sp.]